LPGETVQASGEALCVNGRAAKRDRLRDDTKGVILREEIGDASYEICLQRSPKDEPPDASVTVPADSFFVMGDNRLAAADSRSFGPIPFSAIIGRKL
jgi:signal peptidase I